MQVVMTVILGKNIFNHSKTGSKIQNQSPFTTPY